MLHIIINLFAQDGPDIASQVRAALEKASIQADISLAHKAGEVRELAHRAKTHQAQAIAVFGGDGSVAEAAQALFQSQVPLILLPGGTANVMAKEIEMPLKLEESLNLLTNGVLVPKRIDMGLCNGTPFLIRANIGLVADLVKGASHELKKTIGSAAYGVEAIKKMPESKPVAYQMILDGQNIPIEVIISSLDINRE